MHETKSKQETVFAVLGKNVDAFGKQSQTRLDRKLANDLGPSFLISWGLCTKLTSSFIIILCCPLRPRRWLTRISIASWKAVSMSLIRAIGDIIRSNLADLLSRC